MLDPGYHPRTGDWPAAPALGLGFALRLVRNLAEAAGGALMIEADRFRLLLPAAAIAELRGQRLAPPPTAPRYPQGRGGACSSTVEPAAHNGLVAGSNPAGPTIA